MRECDAFFNIFDPRVQSVKCRVTF